MMCVCERERDSEREIVRGRERERFVTCLCVSEYVTHKNTEHTKIRITYTKRHIFVYICLLCLLEYVEIFVL